jgi:hypothetical protein
MVQLHLLQPVVAAVQAVEAGREQELRPHPPRQPVVGQGQPGQARPGLVARPLLAEVGKISTLGEGAWGAGTNM